MLKAYSTAKYIFSNSFFFRRFISVGYTSSVAKLDTVQMYE
jgi:hypothetical protein